jgi:hypothetical protein
MYLNLVITLSFYQGIMTGILETFSCVVIGDEEYVRFNKSLTCDTYHKEFRIKYILPSFLIWALIPLFIF